MLPQAGLSTCVLDRSGRRGRRNGGPSGGAVPLSGAVIGASRLDEGITAVEDLGVSVSRRHRVYHVAALRGQRQHRTQVCATCRCIEPVLSWPFLVTDSVLWPRKPSSRSVSDDRFLMTLVQIVSFAFGGLTTHRLPPSSRSIEGQYAMKTPVCAVYLSGGA